LILVDDGSRDGSADLVRELGQRPDVRAVVQERNQGKGAAIRRAIQEALSANADMALIQDADLEYDPADHQSVLAPLIDGRADAVIGSRFLGQTHRVLYYWHFVANTALTRLSNMLSNLNLTDMECGTKAFSRDVLQRLTLAEDRFGLEPELVARLAHMRLDQPPRPLRIYEVPVSYAGRTYADGKKITWRDGFSALRCIVRYNIFR
jgi:glycosyltransferase involved in cell wall biosynthesis